MLMGSSLYAASKWFVDTNKTDDTGDGSTWALAKKTIAAASTLGASFDTVMVKGGTYTFTTLYAVATSRHYYGSCAGTETYTSQRPKTDVDGNGIVEPWEFTNPTVLSSTFVGSAFTLPNSGIVFDGFTIKHVATISGGQRTLSLGNATAKFRNNIISGCTVTVNVVQGTSAFSAMMKGLGNISDCLIEKNTYTFNSAQTGDNTINLIELAAGTAVPGTKFRNVILRNNKVNYNLSASATSVGSGRLFIQLSSALTATANTYTTMTNCVIHNNEISYNPGTSIAALNASWVFMSKAASASNADSVVNCTIAKNKINVTGSCATIRADYTSSFTPQFAINNALYDNQCGGSAVGLSIVSTPASGGVFNNVSDASAPVDANPYILGNINGLTSVNCGFLTPTTTIGNTSGVESEHSVWSLIPGSYLFGKGFLSTNLYPTDKAGNLFASTRSAGAYELIQSASNDYFRSKTTGNWSNLSTWESSSNNATWILATAAPTSSAASVSIQSGHLITIAANATSSSLTINPGAKLTLNSTYTLGVTGNLTINSDDTNGTGSFVDNGTTSVSGTTTVKQYVTSTTTGLTGRNWYVSSPLSAALSSAITSATGNGLVYYAGGSSWAEAGSTMDIMKGYIAISPAQNTTITFTGGTLNTGDKSINNLPLGFNLVGNPYASYVNWTDATKTNISTSIWYRSKSTGSYLFQTYNVAGDGISVNGGIDLIPPMQSFWVKTTNTTNSLGFTNLMRSHQDQTVLINRLKAPKVSTQQFLRLQVSNGTNRDEAVIYVNANAQNTLDAYDSQKMFSNMTEVPEIYTQIGTDKLVINGMNALPYDTEIPLGFSTLQSNNFSISASEVKNFDAETYIILKDKLKPNTETELSQGVVYNFSSDITTPSTDRFSIIFRTRGISTGFKNIENENQVLKTIQSNHQIRIDSNLGQKGMVSICNTIGQKLMCMSTTGTLLSKRLNSGVYFVTVNVNGISTTKKVIIN